MVGRIPPAQDGTASQASHALISLLREGGQWDDEDDLRSGRPRTGSKGYEGNKRWDEEEPQVPRITEVSLSARVQIWLRRTSWTTSPRR